MPEKYLPIGSVVLLGDSPTKLMITGYMVLYDNVIYDYSACIYPEGIQDSNRNILFNHDKITEIIFKNKVTEEEEKFFDNLKKLEEKNYPQVALDIIAKNKESK